MMRSPILQVSWATGILTCSTSRRVGWSCMKRHRDLLPVNWSEFGEKFSVRFGERRTRETVDENVEIQRATDRIHS